MIIRPYQPEDCEALARLFYETVHTVNAKDYTEQQLNAWATGTVDLEAWDRSLTAHFTLVAEENGVITGFWDMDPTGYLDRDGKQIPPGAQGLAQIASISSEHVLPELSECTFRIACDVNNPLCGPRGASAVYGPQKGADEAMIQVMDRGLAHFAEIAGKWNPKADPEFPGTGAAGGLGFAFLTFTSAALESGIQIVLEETKLREYVKDADLVITGEGRLDGQTVMGKAPVGVARIAKEFHKPVLALSGSVTREAAACNDAGIDAFFPILRSVVTLEEAMDPENARRNMADTAEQVFRLIQAVRPMQAV